MRTLAEAHQAAQEAVPHGREPAHRPEGAPAPPSGSCARCGAPVSPRPGARYCSPACRLSGVRERRAVARCDLLDALRALREAITRVEAALDVMGFNPSQPRVRRAQEPRHE